MSTKLDFYVPVVDPREIAPIRNFLKEYFYAGERRYVITTMPQFTPREVREKRVAQGYAKIALKVALFFTGIVPILAAIHLVHHAATCNRTYIVRTERPRPPSPPPAPLPPAPIEAVIEPTPDPINTMLDAARSTVATPTPAPAPVQVVIEPEPDTFTAILHAALSKSRTQIRMKDSVHAFLTDFRAQLQRLTPAEQMEILLAIPSRCSEIELEWCKKDGAHYRQSKEGLFDSKEILKDCFEECFGERLIDHPNMQSLLTEIYGKKQAALTLSAFYFSQIDRTNSNQTHNFTALEIATKQSHELLQDFSKEELQSENGYPELKKAIEELATIDFTRVFDMTEVTAFAKIYNPLAKLFDLQELKIENDTDNDSILAEALLQEELQAQMDYDALLASQIEMNDF